MTTTVEKTAAATGKGYVARLLSNVVTIAMFNVGKHTANFKAQHLEQFYVRANAACTKSATMYIIFIHCRQNSKFVNFF